jgi:hypothetical protein
VSDAPARRFPWWVYTLALALILLVALAPLISVMIAGTIAEANGCTLHEGFVNPCLVNGTDMGETLYAMGVMGWFMLATIPLGAMALVAWLVILVIHLIARRRRRTAR